MLSADDPPGDANALTAPEEVDQGQQAEHATVAALLLAGPQLQRSILEAVRPEDFDDVRSRFVVTLAAEMVANGEPLDSITLIGHVTREAKLAAGIPRAGMYSFVAGLTGDCLVVPTSGPWYAAAVVEHAARSKVSFAGAQLIALAADAALADLKVEVLTVVAPVVEAVARAEQVAV